MSELNYVTIERDELTIIDNISDEEFLRRIKGHTISANGLELGTVMTAEFKNDDTLLKLGVLPT